MAKDITTGSTGKGSKSKQSAASYRAKHRVNSAASAERKREAGMIRLSVWVPIWAADTLKSFAKSLCARRHPDDNAHPQAEDEPSTRSGSISARTRNKRKVMPRDDGQLDLFGSA